MTAAQARRILRVLGWGDGDFRRQINRVARTRYRTIDVRRWLSGACGVPLAVAVFLRMELRNNVATRRLLRVLWDREADC